MDGVGPVNPPDPKLYTDRVVWKHDQRERAKPRPSANTDDEDEDPASEDQEGLDLEA